MRQREGTHKREGCKGSRKGREDGREGKEKRRERMKKRRGRHKGQVARDDWLLAFVGRKEGKQKRVKEKESGLKKRMKD